MISLHPYITVHLNPFLIPQFLYSYNNHYSKQHHSFARNNCYTLTFLESSKGYRVIYIHVLVHPNISIVDMCKTPSGSHCPDCGHQYFCNCSYRYLRLKTNHFQDHKEASEFELAARTTTTVGLYSFYTNPFENPDRSSRRQEFYDTVDGHRPRLTSHDPARLASQNRSGHPVAQRSTANEVTNSNTEGHNLDTPQTLEQRDSVAERPIANEFWSVPSANVVVEIPAAYIDSLPSSFPPLATSNNSVANSTSMNEAARPSSSEAQASIDRPEPNNGLQSRKRPIAETTDSDGEEERSSKAIKRS